MYSFLRGQLVSKYSQSPKGAYFIIDVNGVGYEVASSIRSVEAAPLPGETCLLYTSLIVREDSMSLVGFNTHEERDLFNILHSAQGVGPKVALAILSALSVPEIAQAVMSDNFKMLTVAKGIGPKLAQKITVDLKEKMTAWRQLEGQHLDVLVGASDVSLPKEQRQARHDAENVLLSLGYSNDEIQRGFQEILQQAKSDDQNLSDSEYWLRESLRWLALSIG